MAETPDFNRSSSGSYAVTGSICTLLLPSVRTTSDLLSEIWMASRNDRSRGAAFKDNDSVKGRMSASGSTVGPTNPPGTGSFTFGDSASPLELSGNWILETVER